MSVDNIFYDWIIDQVILSIERTQSLGKKIVLYRSDFTIVVADFRSMGKKKLNENSILISQSFVMPMF